LRAKIGKARLIAVLEFGSYTMRSGVHREKIQEALHDADIVVCKTTDQDWGLKDILAKFTQPTSLYQDVDNLVRQLALELHSGDHVVIMSNSGFGGIHEKLLATLEKG
jgi:UDP-N-acetylmuramate: L-alanyl-gamma-D-glutamyl-meso-diaminopimelate ligase